MFIALKNTIAGSGRRVFSGSGAPADGTDEVQTVTITGSPTGGTFRLAYGVYETSDLAFDSTAAQVQTALLALSVFSAGDLAAAGGALPATAVTVTFGDNYGRKDVSLLTVADNSLTGGTDPAVAVTETTPGVEATLRNQPVGTFYVDEDTGEMYANAGAEQEPAWELVGTQA